MRTLLVDDDADFAEGLAAELRDRGWDVDVRGDAEAAFVDLETEEYDLVLSDVRLPHADGLSVLRRARIAWPETPVVLMTSFGDVESVVAAMRNGATAYLEKPLDVETLAEDVLGPVEDRALVHAALGSLELPPCPIVAPRREVPTARALRPVLASIANGREPVVLSGERGAGPVLAARLLHRVGPFGGDPFVVLDARTLLALMRVARRSDLAPEERAAFARFARAGTIVLCEPFSLTALVQIELGSAIDRWFIAPRLARARVVVATAAVPDDAELGSWLRVWGARWIDVPHC